LVCDLGIFSPETAAFDPTVAEWMSTDGEKNYCSEMTVMLFHQTPRKLCHPNRHISCTYVSFPAIKTATAGNSSL
jgi:hypothetical protein